MGTIEDVEYLKQNSIIKKRIVLIDSQKRDKVKFQQANPCVFDLVPHITNVVGIKLKDVYAPFSVFTIEDNNRDAYFRTGFRAKSVRRRVKVRMQKKDYNFDDMLSERFGAAAEDSGYNIGSLMSEYGISVGSAFFADKVNSDINYLTYEAFTPFIIDIDEGTTAIRVMGFQQDARAEHDPDLKIDHDTPALYRTIPYFDEEFQKNLPIKGKFKAYESQHWKSNRKGLSSLTIDENYEIETGQNYITYRDFHSNLDTSGYLVFLDETEYDEGTNGILKEYDMSPETEIIQTIYLSDVFDEFLQNDGNESIDLVENNISYTFIVQRMVLQINAGQDTVVNNLIANEELIWEIWDLHNDDYSVYVNESTEDFTITGDETGLETAGNAELVLSGTFTFNATNNTLTTVCPIFSNSVDIDNDQYKLVGRIKWDTDKEQIVIDNFENYLGSTSKLALKIRNTSTTDTLTFTTIPHTNFNGGSTNPIYSNMIGTNGSSDYRALSMFYRYRVFYNKEEPTSSIGFPFKNYVIISPLVSDTINTKYIKMICDELDNSIDSANHKSNPTSPGLAVFYVRGGSKSYNNTDLRAYGHIDHPEFHPIARLNKLTISFLTDDNRVIDFKGLEYSFLMEVSYRVPMFQKPWKRSILNPNYNGNFIEYMRYHEEREEQIKPRIDNNFNNYIKRENEIITQNRDDVAEYMDEMENRIERDYGYDPDYGNDKYAQGKSGIRGTGQDDQFTSSDSDGLDYESETGGEDGEGSYEDETDSSTGDPNDEDNQELTNVTSQYDRQGFPIKRGLIDLKNKFGKQNNY
jgi:hypothetical protein